MRVQVLRQTRTEKDIYNIGDIVNLNYRLALQWQRLGIGQLLDPTILQRYEILAAGQDDILTDTAELLADSTDLLTGQTNIRGDISDVYATTGTPEDKYFDTTLQGRANGLYQHIHQVARVWPSHSHATITDDIVVATSATAKTLGDFVTVIPANEIAQSFDLHWVNISDMSGNGVFELVFYAGEDDVEIARLRTVRTDNFTKVDNKFIESPIILANSRVRCKASVSTAGAKNVSFSLGYHVYDLDY